MVYYLRPTKPTGSRLESTSQPTSEVSEPSSSMLDSTENMAEKYYPCFLHAIYALAITFLLCHLMVKLMPTLVPFLTRKDENGNLHISHKQAYMVSGVVGLIALVVSCVSQSKE